ncbi:GRB10-interacting GYF protein 1 isoform X2 [Carettochelys insculpta]|uniref:GRB10-interacting GYF protein 1 isoform X2 n=1 Tax=Carettochelys insculpta TaxID=44489 RepID=UPI003EBA0F3A
MAAETLNFGPEWLRALSSRGSMASPPASPAMPKYKLAEYRYGREEMLALYVKENKVPDEMQEKDFAAILQEEPLQPLALVPLTEEEQRNFSMSVNSVAVLRLMGKGGGAAPTGITRGRGSARSRGRGRGESGFYQRSPEEAEGAFGRGGREMHRSQSWDDRGERRFEKPTRRDGARAPFEEGALPPRKDYARSDSTNWRTLREEDDEEGGGGAGPTPAGGAAGGSWRLSGSRRESERWRSASPEGAARSAGWREPPEGRRRKFELREREEERGGRRPRGSEPCEEDKDGLPEWCLDDEDEEMGTFDSSGAFLPLKKSTKEPILEEQEFEFHPLPEEDARSELPADGQEGAEPSGQEAPEKEARKDPCTAPEEKRCSPPGALWLSAPPFTAAIATATSECERAPPGGCDPAPAPGTCDKEPGPAAEEDPAVLALPSQLSPDAVSALSSPSPITNAATEFSIGDNEDDDGMKHLQQEAEKMVASLQESSLEEEGFGQALPEPRNTAAALPLSHEAAMKWFYKDPQGEIQGPFPTQEMAEWFQAGYFSMSLLVKRGCDEGFQPLGEVIKMWGRVPFAPGPSPPPLLGNLDQERLKKQQELAAAALYQQLQHQQFLQLISRYLPDRPQFSPCVLQQKVATGDLTPQQLTAFLQQLQALKARSGEQSMMPAMNRSMSVPDTGSLWDTHTSASQPAGGEASLWDIPINSSSQGPILEQLQLQQKLQERREAELRAKREEEERKRREEKRRQEEQKRREEEELYRRKQCRQQELVLKLLQHSQAQSAAWGGLAKPVGGVKALLELQESERQLHKQQRAQQRAHGALAMNSPSQWSTDSSQLWGSHEKNVSLWEESVKNAGPLVRSLGLKNSRSSPSLGDSYGAPGRQGRKKTEEEEKLLKLLQGMHKPQDGFTQWCEQMLHVLSTSSNLDVPTVVAFLKETESPYAVHDFIRSYLGDTLEAKEFAKQFLERRAKQKASQQRQQQQEASWLGSSSLPSAFPASHSSKQPPYEASQPVKIKRRPVMLHADPSILGYLLHGPSGEVETIEDY